MKVCLSVRSGSLWRILIGRLLLFDRIAVDVRETVLDQIDGLLEDLRISETDDAVADHEIEDVVRDDIGAGAVAAPRRLELEPRRSRLRDERDGASDDDEVMRYRHRLSRLRSRSPRRYRISTPVGSVFLQVDEDREQAEE